jgi:hypothetical protein
MKYTTYIKVVVAVMVLLMITRVQYFLTTSAIDMQIVLFTIVEAVLLIWGVLLVLKKDGAK